MNHLYLKKNLNLLDLLDKDTTVSISKKLGENVLDSSEFWNMEEIGAQNLEFAHIH